MVPQTTLGMTDTDANHQRTPTMSPIEFKSSPEKPLNKTAPNNDYMTAEKSNTNEEDEGPDTDRDGFTQAATERGLTF